MPDLILQGYVKTEEGPQEFQVYRYGDSKGGTFTMVDVVRKDVGRVTLNGCGGLAAFAKEHGVYYRNRFELQRKRPSPLPSDDAGLVPIEDLTDWDRQQNNDKPAGSVVL